MTNLDMIIHYYDVEMLARRWDCHADEVRHLIETKQLAALPRTAAAKGKRGLWVVPFYDDVIPFRKPALNDVPEGCYPIFYKALDGEDYRDVVNRAYDEMKAAGDYDQVVPAEDVERFESGSVESIASTTNQFKPAFLTSKEMIQAFEGLNEWSYHSWKRHLSDPAKWLKTARMSSSGPPNPNRWDPVLLARVLMVRTKVDLKKMNDRFKSCTTLLPWQSEWSHYEDHMNDK
jgi:hypothetical protein